jgi:hypothetical protein
MSTQVGALGAPKGKGLAKESIMESGPAPTKIIPPRARAY